MTDGITFLEGLHSFSCLSLDLATRLSRDYCTVITKKIITITMITTTVRMIITSIITKIIIISNCTGLCNQFLLFPINF